MGKILENLNVVLIIGFVAAVGLMMGFHVETPPDALVLVTFRWLHVFFGILWIGLLYYFNFVQIPTMPTIPAELSPRSASISPPRLCSIFAGRRC